jgi:hypothetical protein
VTEGVPAPEPGRRPTLSPDPEQAWRPGPRRSQPPEEIGPAWRRWEGTHIVLGLIAIVIVVMVIMVVALVLNALSPVRGPDQSAAWRSRNS